MNYWRIALIPINEASVNTRVGAWTSQSAKTGLLSRAFCNATTLLVASCVHRKGTFPVRSVKGFANEANPLTKIRWNPATLRKACTSFLFCRGGFYTRIASLCERVIRIFPWDK